MNGKITLKKHYFIPLMLGLLIMNSTPQLGTGKVQMPDMNALNILLNHSKFIAEDDVLNSSTIPKSIENDVRLSDLNNYSLSIDLNDTSRLVDVSFKLDFRNPTGEILNNIFINHPLLSYKTNFLSSEQKDIVNYPWGFEDIQLNYENMTINNLDANFSIFGTSLNISLPEVIKPNEVFEVKFDFQTSVPWSARRYGAMNSSEGERILVLSNLIPSVAVYENNKWRNDAFRFIADPFYAEIANYRVDITHDKDFVLGSTGSLINETAISYKRQLSRYSALKVRDFAFAGSPSYVKEVLNATMPSGRIVPVTSLYQPSFTSKYQNQAEFGVAVLEYFSENLIEYAYDQLTIVQTTQAFGGMEYPQFVTISVQSGVESVVAHELAHQWNYVMVGSDQFNEGWLDEGLATFLTNLYRLDKGQINLEKLNKDRFFVIDQMNLGQIPINNTADVLTNFGGLLQYTASGMVFLDFMNTIGKDLMFYILGNYYSENRYLMVDATQLVDEFVKSLGQDWPRVYFDFMWNSPIPRIITPSAELLKYGCGESEFNLSIAVNNPGILQRIVLFADVGEERLLQTFFLNESISFAWNFPVDRIEEIKIAKLGFTFADTFPETLFTSVQYRNFPPTCEVPEETSSSSRSTVLTTLKNTSSERSEFPSSLSSKNTQSQLILGNFVISFVFITIFETMQKLKQKNGKT